jgi:hypothetical protein
MVVKSDSGSSTSTGTSDNGGKSCGLGSGIAALGGFLLLALGMLLCGDIRRRHSKSDCIK